MHFVQHLLGTGGGINAATGTRYLADDGVACLVYLGQRKAQAIKVRDFFEAWIREISPTDLPCTFEQMSNQCPFAQQCPVVFCPAEFKHLWCEKQRRIRHPARYDNVSIGAQSVYDPFGAQVGIGRNQSIAQGSQGCPVVESSVGAALQRCKHVIPSQRRDFQASQPQLCTYPAYFASGGERIGRPHIGDDSQTAARAISALAYERQDTAHAFTQQWIVPCGGIRQPGLLR
ncbi:hypothetical protein D3C73_659110 [compost metagenome]